VIGKPLFRPGVLTLLIAFVFVCLFTSGGAAQDRGGEEPEQAEGKPNIVLILTDDQAFSDLSSGAMPKTNALLVKRGATYRQAYVTLSVCCPSRATILRGQYAHNHRVIDNHRPTGGAARFKELGLEESTVATWLQGAGYETSMIGKYMNGYSGDHVAPGWDDWHVLSNFFPRTRTMNNNGTEETFPGTIEGHLGRRAVEFIEGAEDPFYLHVGTHAPHDPYEYQPAYRTLHRGAKPPRYAS
jgi:arylsulfatase A-like enzyme